MNSVEKLKKLGLEFTSDFGNKFRSFLNTFVSGENERYGDYVGYQLNLPEDKLIIIQDKGTYTLKLNNYSDFPNNKSYEILKSSMVHFDKGGNMKNDIPEWLGVYTYPNAYIYTDKRIDNKIDKSIPSGDYKRIGMLFFSPLKLEIEDGSSQYSIVHDIMKSDYEKLKKEGKVQVSSSGQYANVTMSKEDYEDILNELYSLELDSKEKAINKFSYLKDNKNISDKYEDLISEYWQNKKLGKFLRKYAPLKFGTMYTNYIMNDKKEKGGEIDAKFEDIKPRIYFINQKYAGKTEDDIKEEIITDYKKGIIDDYTLWDILNDNFILSSKSSSHVYKELGFKPFSGFPLVKLQQGGIISNDNQNKKYDIIDEDGDIIKSNLTEEQIIDYISTVVFYELEDIQDEQTHISDIEEANQVLKAHTDMHIVETSTVNKNKNNNESGYFEDGGEFLESEEIEEQEDEIPSNLYMYRFSEERGEISASVENMKTGTEVWSFKYPDYSLDAEERDFQSTPVEDGFMRHWEDISGLEKYLKRLDILQQGEEIISEYSANHKYDYYKNGGTLNRDYSWVKSKPFYEIGEKIVIKDKNGVYSIVTKVKDKYKDRDKTTLYIAEDGGASYMANEIKPYTK